MEMIQSIVFYNSHWNAGTTRQHDSAQARRDVNCSAVVAKAILDKLQALEVLDRFAEKANLAQPDADEIAEIIDEAMARRGKKARS